MEYYGLVGQGPFQEVLVCREPRGDGLEPSDPGYRGTRFVSQEPTGVVYRSFREGEKGIADKNHAIAREVRPLGRPRKGAPVMEIRRCVGSAKFGIEAHEAPVEDFPKQASQKDGLGRMCRLHWNQYTTALRKSAEARKAEGEVDGEGVRATPPPSDIAEVADAEAPMDGGTGSADVAATTDGDGPKVAKGVDEAHLAGLLGARAYRDSPHTVLTVDTRRLVERHHEKVRLSSINSGSLLRGGALRGPETLRALADYDRPYVIELCVLNGVPDIDQLALSVEHRWPDGRRVRLLPRLRAGGR